MCACMCERERQSTPMRAECRVFFGVHINIRMAMAECVAMCANVYTCLAPYTARHCKTLQDNATHCNTLQHSATHCNTLQHTATDCYIVQHTANTHYNTQQHAATCSTRCNTLQHAATHCNTLQHTATHCNTLQQGNIRCTPAVVNAKSVWKEHIHTATHCNTLQHSATGQYKMHTGSSECQKCVEGTYSASFAAISGVKQCVVACCNVLQCV